MGLRVIPHWCDWRVLGIVLTPLILLPVVALGFPLIQRFRSSEAQAAMQSTPAKIDGKRAFGYLEKICEIGPRVAGTEANARQRKMVAEHFAKAGGKVKEQPFHAEHPLTGRRVDMVNLIGSWHPERLRRVVICAHYDTRPRADQEEDAERLNQPFLGANDGASGVALLMEIANHLNTLETPWGVDLVLFDGEELVYGNNPRRGEYFLGSWHFARAYAEQRERGARPRMQYDAGILLDMVGGKNMTIKREPNSLEFAPDLVREVWTVARQLDARSFSNEVGREVMDDHLPLNDARIPSIDLIDFDYPHWHKIDDVPKNCSAESLAEVGRVVTAWLAQPHRRTRR
jgi:glutaminyl-peptide cyclotransferase